MRSWSWSRRWRFCCRWSQEDQSKMKGIRRVPCGPSPSSGTWWSNQQLLISPAAEIWPSSQVGWLRCSSLGVLLLVCAATQQPDGTLDMGAGALLQPGGGFSDASRQPDGTLIQESRGHERWPWSAIYRAERPAVAQRLGAPFIWFPTLIQSLKRQFDLILNYHVRGMQDRACSPRELST